MLIAYVFTVYSIWWRYFSSSKLMRVFSHCKCTLVSGQFPKFIFPLMINEDNGQIVQWGRKRTNMALTSMGDWLQQPKLMTAEAANFYCFLNIRTYVGTVKRLTQWELLTLHTVSLSLGEWLYKNKE